jgi:hypothetical protein
VRSHQLGTVVIAAVQDLGGRAEDPRVLFLDAVRTPDLVDQVLIGRGRRFTEQTVTNAFILADASIRIAAADVTAIVKPGIPPAR